MIGFPSTGGYTPVLENAHFRKVGSASVPVSVPITAEQALTGNYDAELVEIGGKLKEDKPDLTGLTLILQSRNVVFGATVNQAALPKGGWLTLATGSQLRLKGICSVRVDEDGNPTAFSILLQSPGDITVLAKPPWWTGSRLASLLVVLAGILIASALWVAFLRRRVDEQTATFRATLESTGDGILVVNSSGVVVAYNRKFVGDVGPSRIGLDVAPPQRRAQVRGIAVEGPGGLRGQGPGGLLGPGSANRRRGRAQGRAGVRAAFRAPTGERQESGTGARDTATLRSAYGRRSPCARSPTG